MTSPITKFFTPNCPIFLCRPLTKQPEQPLSNSPSCELLLLKPVTILDASGMVDWEEEKVDTGQRIADLVVDQMGGLVGDADEMMKRCRVTSNELRNSLNTVILPLGHVDVGLSRHRSLLFKVLADRINLSCMLVKGSLYTGTDDGAVNLIKIDDGSEYIIGLMGAPGTRIPAEVPSSLLVDSALGARGFSGSSGSTNKLSLVLHKVARHRKFCLMLMRSLRLTGQV
ncbi:hypothetical protein Nepgr_016597 [Nepenthes gracilis]|uniref:EDR1/CTR1/ARMC3-like peptidase-like domain-containing protein n=1 Tax=Nepenthes gracilis TaxID=150966 RepID=A0AAD3SQL7_NEPGR|nr:hypothetical protein Nepgr_016597 [Nepenthes gracilis]